MTTVAIHQPEYFPPLRTLHKLASADRVVFLLGRGVKFDRASCQHRARVCVPGSGPRCWATIPFRHVGGYQELVDVQSAEPPSAWARRHLSRFVAEFGASPFWRAELEPLLRVYVETVSGAAYPNGWHVAYLAMLSVLDALQALGVSRDWATDAMFGVEETDRTARLVACCRALGADEYLSGRTGAEVIDRRQFERVGIAVRVHEYAPFDAVDGVEPSVLATWARFGRERLRRELPSGARP